MAKKYVLKSPLPLNDVVFQWLRGCGFRINRSFCQEQLLSHPDYPSLISVVDLLDIGGMRYKAVRADGTYISQFNYPLLAHVYDHGNEHMHIVYNAKDWSSNSDLVDHWSGVVLFPERGAVWNNAQNDIYRQEALKKKIALTFFLIFLAGVTFWACVNIHSWIVNLYALFSLFGLGASVAAAEIELGIENQILKQVCGIVERNGCKNVLKSKYAQGIAGVTVSDSSLAYFASLVTLHIFSFVRPDLLCGLRILSLLGLVVVLWSIYAQAIKLKYWCTVCLCIDLVLILQAGVSTRLPVLGSGFFSLIAFWVLFASYLSILIPVKQLIKKNNSNKAKIAELKKWRTDTSLFLYQYRDQRQVDTDIWENDLLLGEIDAPILITTACNPYCAPCAKAHKRLDLLLEKYKDKISVQVRLLFSQVDPEDRRTKAARAIFKKAAVTDGKAELKELLADWFEWMNLEKWSAKWQPESSVNVDEQLVRHTKWVSETDIKSTPTFFINGRKVSSRYSLDDLDLMLPGLIDIFSIPG